MAGAVAQGPVKRLAMSIFTRIRKSVSDTNFRKSVSDTNFPPRG
jgi:hypothetical protein